MKTENPVVLTGSEFARLLGKSVGWVTKQTKAGMPHEGGGGRGMTLRIPFAPACDWLVDRAVIESKRPETQADRLRREQANAKALDNAALRAGLCYRQDVQSVVAEVVRRHASERNGIASRLSAVIPGRSPAEIRGLILDELRRCDELFASERGAMAGAEEASFTNGRGALLGSSTSG